MDLNKIRIKEVKKVWRRLIASILIAFSIISFSTLGFAAPDTTIDKSKYEILNPEKSSFSTSNKVILINGKAPTGTEITIDVYGTTDLTRKNFNLDQLPTEEDYIEIMTDTVKSGNMGFFQKQIDLVLGINKIIITFDVEELSPEELIIYVYDKTKAETEITKAREAKFSEIVPLLN